MRMILSEGVEKGRDDLDASLLLLGLSALEPSAPHYLGPVLQQLLDELKLVKIQLLHKLGLHVPIVIATLPNVTRNLTDRSVFTSQDIIAWWL